MKAFAFASLMSLAAAGPVARAADAGTNYLVGLPAALGLVNYADNKFSVSSIFKFPGTGPTWFLPIDKERFWSVDENGKNLYMMKVTDGKIANTTSAVGSQGVVHLAYNKDKTKILGAAYGSGAVDIWDIARKDSNGQPRLTYFGATEIRGKKNSTLAGNPHQTVLDPTGRFFAVPDLGLNSIFIIDAQCNYHVVSEWEAPQGCGPRHGAWVSLGKGITGFAFVCETNSKLILLKATYNKRAVTFQQLGRAVSTFGDVSPNAGSDVPKASELLVSGNKVLVSNRIAPSGTDSVTQFTLNVKDGRCGDQGDECFTDAVNVDSLGQRVRSMAFSADGKTLIVANQAGDEELVAFDFGPNGLATTPKAKSGKIFGEGEFPGAQFVLPF